MQPQVDLKFDPELLFWNQDDHIAHAYRTKRRDPHLGCGGGQRPGHHRSVGHLDRQVFVVNERPGSFHLTCLEVVTECSEVWISKEATVGVVGRRCVAKKTPLIVADLRAIGALLAVRQERRRRKRYAGTWLGCRPLLGAVVLAH